MSRNDDLKVGVVGVGRMGQRHCRVYANLRRVRLAGVCDPDPEVGRTVASLYEVPFFASTEDLLRQVEAVSLAAPTGLHFDLAIHCLSRGVHVLVEKPMTGTIEQAEALAQAAAASDLTVAVGHIERFNPAYIELKHVLEDMKMLAVNIRRLSPYSSSNKDVDVVLDLMLHDLDLVSDLIGGDPLLMGAYGLSAVGGTADYAVAQLGCIGGPLVTLTASRVTEQKIRSVEVTAQEAYLEGDLLNKGVAVYRHAIGEYLNHNRQGVKYRHECIVERIHVPNFEPLFLELQHFVDCILDGKRPLISAEDGLRGLRLANEIRRTIYDGLAHLREALSPDEQRAAVVYSEMQSVPA